MVIFFMLYDESATVPDVIKESHRAIKGRRHLGISTRSFIEIFIDEVCFSSSTQLFGILNAIERTVFHELIHLADWEWTEEEVLSAERLLYESHLEKMIRMLF